MKHRLIMTFSKPLAWDECFEMIARVRKLDKGAGFRIIFEEASK